MSSEEDNYKYLNKSFDKHLNKSLDKSTDNEQFSHNMNVINKNKINSKNNNSDNNTLDSIRVLPSFIEKVNLNIQNIDNLLNSREINNNANSNQAVSRKGSQVNKNQMARECFDIKNLVKQSVEGINDILSINTN